MPEAERTRGATFADRLTIPALARAWQMLLKGVGEVESAPGSPRRRRNGFDPVVSCLRYAAARGPGAAPERGRGRGRWWRACGGGRIARRRCLDGAVRRRHDAGGRQRRAPMAQGFVETVTEGPRLASFRDVAALVEEQREAMLHAHLLHSAHLVRFAPPVIELRTQPEAPRDLAPKLAALLSERHRHALDHRAVDRRRGADAGRTRQRRRRGAARGSRRPSVGPRDHGGVSRRANRLGA